MGVVPPAADARRDGAADRRGGGGRRHHGSEADPGGTRPPGLDRRPDGAVEPARLRGDRPEDDGARAGRRPGFGLIIVDLDRFKPVNDTYGHATGDEALREIAARLRRYAGAGDAAARIGGDEFALLLEGVDSEQLARLASRLVEVLGRPIPTTVGRITVGASIGAAVWRSTDRDLAALWARADAELFVVKRTGRGAWRMAA